MFKPRYTKPEAGNKYYIRKADGGYSDAILGKPTDPDCNVLSNCVGMSYGRFNEVGEWGYCKYLRPVNAGDFMDFKGDCETGFDPREGACMVWKKSGSAGHVASVEKVIDNDTVVTSESSYNGQAFYTKTRHRGDGNWEQNGYTFKGFIYNPAVKPLQEEYNELMDAYLAQVGDIATVQGEKVELLKEVETLSKTILTQSEAHQKEVEKLSKAKDKIATELTDVKLKNTELEATLDTYSAETDKIIANIEQKHAAELSERDAQAILLTENLQNAQKKIREIEAAADKQISQLQEDLTKLEAAHQQEISALNKTLHDLEERDRAKDKIIKLPQRGDINGDGKVNIADLFALIVIIFGRKKEK